MKVLSALSLLTLSLSSFAQQNPVTTVTVPYPTHHQRYYGGLDAVESHLRSELDKKAIAFCGTKDNVAGIADVEVKVAFSLIMKDETKKFEGGYPLGSVTAEVVCHR